jgi:hypothetical protein
LIRGRKKSGKGERGLPKTLKAPQGLAGEPLGDLLILIVENLSTDSFHEKFSFFKNCQPLGPLPKEQSVPLLFDHSSFPLKSP